MSKKKKLMIISVNALGNITEVNEFPTNAMTPQIKRKPIRVIRHFRKGRRIFVHEYTRKKPKRRG